MGRRWELCGNEGSGVDKKDKVVLFGRWAGYGGSAWLVGSELCIRNSRSVDLHNAGLVWMGISVYADRDSVGGDLLRHKPDLV